VHDTHHPISTSLYYEDQKEEAVRAAQKYVDIRLPKFLGYFERVLSSKASGGEWLVGGKVTTADLVLFQCLDGTAFQFPKAVGKIRKEGKFGKVFALYERVKELPRIKEYLGSERRQKYSEGIYRYYPDLDLEPQEE
jgi:glutathione S-transferase